MSALKVYLAVEPCDMRMGFNGLTIAAVEHLAQPLASDALFVFVNKRHTRVKLLCFDGTGLWQATKRLEGGTLHWPRGEGTAVALRPEQLSALISGLEVTERAGWYRR